MELQPLLFCPACRSAPPPEPGTRCTGVAGARCQAFRCECGVLLRGRLICPGCDQIPAVDLQRVSCKIGECEGPRRGKLPGSRVDVLVDRNGSGGVWVAPRIWARLEHMYNGHAARAILAAADQVEPIQHYLVGCFYAEGEGPPDGERTRAAEVAGRRVVVTLAKRSPPVDTLPPPSATIEMRLDPIIRVLAGMREVCREPEKATPDQLRSRALQVRELHEDLCAAVMDAVGVGLVGRDVVTLAIPDRQVGQLAAAMDRPELASSRKTSWPVAALEGRFFCGGGACPGLGVDPDRRHPHPESCAAPGESLGVTWVSWGHTAPSARSRRVHAADAMLDESRRGHL